LSISRWCVWRWWRQRMECCRRAIALSVQVPLLCEMLHRGASHFTCTSRSLLHTLLVLLVLMLFKVACCWCFFCHSRTLVSRRMYLKQFTHGFNLYD
jgi:hypothetical protein